MAYATTVASSGVQLISAGGVAYGTVISAGGVADIASGGVVYGADVLGGTVQVAGAAYATSLGQGGQAVVLGGGAVSGTVIESGGVELLSSGASATQDVVLAGGVEVVLPGGAANNTILDGGTLVLLPGASATDVHYLPGGAVVSTGEVLVNPGSAAAIYAGQAANLAVQAGGAAYVLAGGVADSAQLSGNYAEFAVLEVFSGGQVRQAAIGSAGQEYVDSGGREQGATLASGGYLYVSGSASADTLNAGAHMFVQGGGAQALTTVLNGGSVQFVEDGGTAIQATLAQYAVQILSGGTAFDTQIGQGASQYVDAGGSAIDSIVQGEEIISRTGEGVNATLAGGQLILSAGAIFTGNVMFAGGDGALVIHGTTLPSGVIEHFVSGEAIELDGLAYEASYRLSVPAAGMLAIAPGFTLDIQGAVSPGMFNLLDLNGAVEITTDVPCFAEGTRLLTPRGYVEVEALSVGERLITQAGEDAPIIWIGRRRLELRAHPEPASVQPVRIRADAFGPGEPARDLLLSPDHGVLCGGLLVPAKALVNGVNITQMAWAAVTYFHVELAAHSIIFAEDLAVESYLDTGNRASFERVRPGAVAADGQRLRQFGSCAPFAETGPVVVEARHAAARRAMR
jgi:autotransporter passenger strand-loop-strand repeat protein